MNIIDSIGLITVFLLILLSTFLFSQKSTRKVSNVLFGSFLLITSFDISGLFLHEFYGQYVVLNKLRISSAFLQMPLFYLYVKKACFQDFELNKYSLLHLLPFGLFAVLYFQSDLSDNFDIWHAVFAQIQFYTYIIAILVELRKFRGVHRHQYSLKNETYKWLTTTAILFLSANVLVTIRGVYEAFYRFQSIEFLNYGISFFALGIISWFVLKTMRNPELFIRVRQKQSKEKKSINIDEKELAKQLLELDGFMRKEKPFMNDNLSLSGLADLMGVAPKQLSLLINQVSGKHFFDYINKYRIEEAKSLLGDSNLTIQQIMYEVGFNSKSSFNTAFKKHTSLTPSAFRKVLK